MKRAVLNKFNKCCGFKMAISAVNTMMKLSECFNEFTLDVYKNLASKDGSQNLFMSPSSIMVVMTMVHAGARCNKESQIRKTLKLDKLEEKGIHASFEEFVRSIKKESDNFTLTMGHWRTNFIPTSARRFSTATSAR